MLCRLASKLCRGAAVLLVLTLAGASIAPGQTMEPIRRVVPVHLNAATGDITVGNNTYKGANPGMHLLLLSRQPNLGHLDAPDVIMDQSLTDAGAVNQLLQNVRSSTPDALLIVNTVGNYGIPLSSVSQSLEQFGAAHNLDSINSTVPFVMVGNGGRNAGQGWQRGNSTLSFDGYLTQDSNGNYTFLQTDYIQYDITNDGNITIGGQPYTLKGSYKSAGCNNAQEPANVFRLVVVDRESPLNTPPARFANNTYCTAISDGDINQLVVDLGGVTKDPTRLTFLASYGHPIPANRNFGADGDSRLIPLGEAVKALGGYHETIIYLSPNDTYALVGTAAWAANDADPGGIRRRAKESSSVYPDSPSGELHGVLARGKAGNWYAPLNADPSGLANLGLYQVLGLKSTTFPHPANSDELNAFNYIAQQLCDGVECNIRDRYADTNLSIDNYQIQLSTMRDPNNNDCDDKQNAGLPFCIMRNQLLTELRYVSDIRNFNQNLQSIWLGSGSTSILTLLSVYQDVQSTLNVPPNNPAPNLVDPVVNFFLTLGSFIPEIGPVFGLADTAFNIGTSLTTDPSGNPTISLATTVGQLQQQAADQFTAQATTTGTQFDLVYQDWGRLQMLGTALAQAQPGGRWYWDPSATGRILEAMKPGIERAYYENLMSAVYAVGSYLPQCSLCGYTNWGSLPSWQQPRSYITYVVVNPGSGAGAYPFIDPGYAPYTYPGDPENPFQQPGNSSFTQGNSTILSDKGWLGISQKGTPWNAVNYQPPATSILSHLFTPRSQGGLGVYRPAFFNTWAFPFVTCSASEVNNEPGSGCNWPTATAPPETVPGQRTSVSIQLKPQTRKNGPTLYQLTVVNSGTVDIGSGVLRKVKLETVKGNGEAFQAGTLPVKLPALAPGAQFSVPVQIYVPRSVQQLQVVAKGSLDIGETEPVQFSEKQELEP